MFPFLAIKDYSQHVLRLTNFLSFFEKKNVIRLCDLLFDPLLCSLLTNVQSLGSELNKTIIRNRLKTQITFNLQLKLEADTFMFFLNLIDQALIIIIDFTFSPGAYITSKLLVRDIDNLWFFFTEFTLEIVNLLLYFCLLLLLWVKSSKVYMSLKAC